MGKKEFATKISDEELRELRSYAKESKRAISDLVDEALLAHLRAVRIRPAFRSAAAQVLTEHPEALARLAK
jgi:elongation factor P--beta-lysine ligase